jgi:hypothetical protein
MTPRTWNNGPLGNTPITAAALNGMESDIAAAVSSAAASATSAANSAALVGAPSDTVIAAAITGPGTQTATALNATYGRAYRPEAFGAVGDGVTDDLPAFQAIQAAIAKNPAIPASIVVTGTHYVSNSVYFDGENIECYLAAGSHIFTKAPTNQGQTLGFIGYLGSGTATSPVRARVKIHGPGKVTGWRGASPSTAVNNENAIGVVRYASVEIDGPQDLEAGNKAFTTQYGITSVKVRNLGVLRANFRGVSIEDGTTQVDIQNVNVASSGSSAVTASGQKVTVKGIFGDQILTGSYATEAAVRLTGTPLNVGVADDIRIVSAGSGKGLIISASDTLAMADHIRIGASTGNAVEPQNCTGSVYIGVVDAPSSPDKVVAVGTTPAAAVKRINQPEASTVTIAATRLTPVTGTPVVGMAGAQLPGYILDSTAAEAVAVLLGRDVIPASWKTFAVDISWTNTTANVGDVRHDASYTWLGDGDAFATGTYVSGTAQSAPTAFGTQKTTRVVSAITADAAKSLYLRVIRNGGDASDTLANDSGLVAIKLTRLS